MLDMGKLNKEIDVATIKPNSVIKNAIITGFVYGMNYKKLTLVNCLIACTFHTCNLGRSKFINCGDRNGDDLVL